MGSFSGIGNIFRKIAATAANPAGERACNNMTRDYQGAVKDALSRTAHAPHTRTPSAPGSPPSMISGELRESVTATPAIKIGGGWRGSAGPHTRYAAIQEFGGVMHGHPTMSWYTIGEGRQYRHVVVLPERSYLRSTRDRMVADGQLSRASARGFAEVIYTVE